VLLLVELSGLAWSDLALLTLMEETYL
jgi:hypothetical protein